MDQPIHLHVMTKKTVCPECESRGKVVLLPKSKGFILCTVATLGPLRLGGSGSAPRRLTWLKAGLCQSEMLVHIHGPRRMNPKDFGDPLTFLSSNTSRSKCLHIKTGYI